MKYPSYHTCALVVGPYDTSEVRAHFQPPHAAAPWMPDGQIVVHVDALSLILQSRAVAASLVAQLTLALAQWPAASEADQEAALATSARRS